MKPLLVILTAASILKGGTFFSKFSLISNRIMKFKVERREEEESDSGRRDENCWLSDNRMTAERQYAREKANFLNKQQHTFTGIGLKKEKTERPLLHDYRSQQ